MIFTVDNVSFDNVVVSSLKRTVNITSGGNTGTFLNGIRFYDTKESYLSYQLNINASCLSPEDYDTLFNILASPQETHSIEIIYGQGVKTFEAHINSVSDECLKKLANHTLWGNLTVTFNSAEALV